MKAPRQAGMHPRSLRRIGALFQELAEVYEKLAAEEEPKPEKVTKPATSRRKRSSYVPDALPSELDAARARAALKKLGLK